MPVRICLDAGHGGRDSGAVFAGLQEKDICLAVAQRIRNILLVCKFIEPIMTRDSDVFVPLDERVKIGNEAKADYFISIHTNASIRPDTASGSEIWVFHGDRRSRAYAEIMSDWVDMSFPDEPFRGIREGNFFVLRENKIIPSNLIEIGFINNSKTNRKFSDPRTIDDIAVCLGIGILNVVHGIYKGENKTQARHHENYNG